MEVFKNMWFWAAFFSWMVAQITKMVCGLSQTGRLDFRYLVSTGGMPSAHSAMVSGLATSFGLTLGFGSPVFVLALGVALLTMFDAATVRRASGIQAKLLNEIVDQFFKERIFSEKKLVELLGHTRLEVFMGMVVGILTGMLMVSIEVLRPGLFVVSIYE